MKTIKGDLIQLALANEFDVIIHGCNCFCTMGKGIAKSIKTHFPQAYEVDLETEKGDKSKLGTITFANVEVNEKKLIVVNGYTQYNWKGRGRKVDYNAIRNVFQLMKIHFSGLQIAYPAIGAGLVGGDWAIISTIIDEELENEQHTFIEYSKTPITNSSKTIF